MTVHPETCVGGAHLQARVAAELNLPAASVASTARLLAGGATVPFIARYRKEATGSLDEVAIASIRDRLVQYAELEARRAAILKSLEERKLLTPELAQKIAAAGTMVALEDLFAPFRPKRRTRAIIAREKGLEPLADWLLANQSSPADPHAEAARFVLAGGDPDKTVPSAEDALAGARDILAERFSDDPEARRLVRGLFEKEAVLASKALKDAEAKPEAQKFRDYFAWSEPLAHAPSHRLLAMRRGEAEGHLLLRITVDEGRAIGLLEGRFITGNGGCAQQVRLACQDGYQRLLSAQMETEVRLASKKAADAEAIRVFRENLRELLMAPPLGQRKVLAIDPGFRTGCKLAVLDAQGSLLFDDVIYPTGGSDLQVRQARERVRKVAAHFGIEAVAIGNGTASRETEAFIASCGLPPSVVVVMVNESGASVYSASQVAREEFPDKDITVRGAVSIGRRLMDPLAELVKIDPQSIGVGQYQHDVDQVALQRALDDTVVSCVNRVGVEVNTASKQLLRYVSGLNDTVAENIVKHRQEHGPFTARAGLKQVPRLGDKTFEQAAGFLRIRGAANPLDASAVHPESYSAVERMARDAGCQVADLVKDPSLRDRIELERYVSDTIGLPTLKDIMAELAKPGRDPRQQFEVFKFADGIEKPEDIKPGMKLPGIVTNVTAFGAFVDIGVHQDGLVHISQMADTFVKDPSAVVKAGQRVHVTVLDVDLERKRIALSLKTRPDLPSKSARSSERPAPRVPAGPPAKGAGGFNSGLFSAALDKLDRNKP
ncbi:MAG: RNA-binding transcriptional accessory protein [Verrucomicrobia bacterium]|nr:RNA-binding transcriptional accessory protein [Verrucomicrobiota bacterium]